MDDLRTIGHLLKQGGSRLLIPPVTCTSLPWTTITCASGTYAERDEECDLWVMSCASIGRQVFHVLYSWQLSWPGNALMQVIFPALISLWKSIFAVCLLIPSSLAKFLTTSGSHK